MRFRAPLFILLLLLCLQASAQDYVDQDKIGDLVQTHLTEIRGDNGQWMGEYDGVVLMIMTDATHDRMRVMTPILELGSNPDPEELQRCMEANFASALDGRYAIYNEILWAVFVHPMSEFRAQRFESVLQQVSNLALTHGTTYSSGQLQFDPKIEEKEKSTPVDEDSSLGSLIQRP